MKRQLIDQEWRFVRGDPPGNTVNATSAGKSLFLDIDGATSYSQVWLDGRFVRGV